MLLISYLDSDTLDSRQEEVVAYSTIGRKKFFVRVGEDTLKAIPDALVMSKIYPQGIEDPPYVVEYLEEHPEIIDVDFSLMLQLDELH